MDRDTFTLAYMDFCMDHRADELFSEALADMGALWKCIERRLQDRPMPRIPDSNGFLSVSPCAAQESGEEKEPESASSMDVSDSGSASSKSDDEEDGGGGIRHGVAAASSSELTANETAVMQALVKRTDLGRETRARDLTEATELANMTYYINALEDKGFVRKEKVSGRKVFIHPLKRIDGSEYVKPEPDEDGVTRHAPGVAQGYHAPNLDHM